MNKKLINAALAVTAIFALAGADDGCGKPPIIANNGFDLWCGDTLCHWELDKGAVAPAPTWHSDDYAVDLIGDAVAISQVSTITNRDYRCIKFSLLANIEPTATVHIEMDVYDDGLIDWRQPIPASEWSPFQYLVLLPTRYEGVRFRLTKEGSGRALLAQIVAESSGACDMPAIGVTDQPDGAGCSVGENCASGFCTVPEFPSDALGVCSSCNEDSDCAFDQVCGSTFPDQVFLDMYRTCVAPFGQQVGERCVTDNECASGSCCNNVCSTCCSVSHCDDGETCGPSQARSDDDAYDYWLQPWQCLATSSGGGGNIGDECLIDEDCASGTCNGTGTLNVCQLDGRECDTNSDCPDDLQCLTIGTVGGTCE